MLGNHNTTAATRCLIDAPKLFRDKTIHGKLPSYQKAEFEAMAFEPHNPLASFRVDNSTAQSVLDYYNEYTDNFFHKTGSQPAEDRWMSCYWCENHGFWMFHQIGSEATAKRWLGSGFDTEISSGTGLPLRVDKILVHVN